MAMGQSQWGLIRYHFQLLALPAEETKIVIAILVKLFVTRALYFEVVTYLN